MIKAIFSIGRGARIAGLLLGVAFMATGCQTQKAAPMPDIQLVWPSPPDPARFEFEGMIRSSTDVIEETATDRFKRLATGQTMSGKTLGKPYGMAARDGLLFVGDTANRRVAVFDLLERRYWEIGTEGPGALSKPLGLALDDMGKIYVCDGTAKRVVVFDYKGNYLGAVGGRDFFSRPTGVAVNKDGSKIFVVDTGGVSSRDHRVRVFNAEGEHLYDIGKRGNRDGELNLPLNAAIFEDETLYVVDGGNFRVQAFDLDGTHKFTIGTIGKRSGQFARPKGIAISPAGNIYVADSAFGNFQIFDPKGDLLMWIGSRGTQSMPGKYLLPSGIAVDRSDGRIYFADQYFRRVDIFRPAATPKERPEKRTTPIREYEPIG